jgi:hypothetical protein
MEGEGPLFTWPSETWVSAVSLFSPGHPTRPAAAAVGAGCVREPEDAPRRAADVPTRAAPHVFAPHSYLLITRVDKMNLSVKGECKQA